MPVKKVVVEKCNRLYQLAPGLDTILPRERRRPLVRKTVPLDLATFRWPVPAEVDEADWRTFLRPAGRQTLDGLKEELAAWFNSYHGVKLDADKEIFVGGGISQLIYSVALAFVDQGAIAFVPELGIPLYRRVTTACGGEAVGYGISLRDNFQPDFERVGTKLGRIASLLFLNSPHNPTGVELADREMANLVWLAGRENIIVVNDAAYSAVSARRYPSLLAVSGGKRVGVEVYSFAYGFGLPGIPFGFMAGNREVIQSVKIAAQLTPSFVSEYFVSLARQAIRRYPSDQLRAVRSLLASNAGEMAKILGHLNLEKESLDTIPYIWARIERRRQAGTAAALLYRWSRVMALPGTALGDAGEGFLRFSLTAPSEAYRAAADRVRRKHRRVKLGGGE